MNAWLVFLDESGFLLAPLVRRSWNPHGRTPVLRQRTGAHSKLSVIACLCVSPDRDRVRLYFRLHANQSIDTSLVIGFLRGLMRQLDAPAVLVWDRLGAHRAHKVRDFLLQERRLHTRLLPPYAPELNPVENVWSYLKLNPLSNLALSELDGLVEQSRRHSRALQKRERLLRSFVRHTPLPLRLT